MVKVTDDQKFEFGRLVASEGVAWRRKNDSGFNQFVIRSIFRYAAGDWGDCSEHDRDLNDLSLKLEAAGKGPNRIIAVYKSEEYPEIWIITEADRSYTTVLYPDEY